MESSLNVSSEEELLELRNDGKINEGEYEDLLETLRKTSKADVKPVAEEQPMPVQTCGLAVASLVLSLLGPLCSIPAIICGHLALRKITKTPALSGRGLALAGTIVGYVVLGFSLFLFGPIMLYWDLAESHQTGQTTDVIPLQRLYPASTLTELRSFPLDSKEGLITQTGVQIDNDISSDGNGSMRIEAKEITTIRLFETGDIDIERARLIYQAKVRTENLEGQVYLEMWCHFPSKGEFFSKGLKTPLTGTTDWTNLETTFLLKKGENPDNIRLNLVITGKGTVWIDDVRLVKGTLP
jgi:hypothetical protein